MSALSIALVLVAQGPGDPNSFCLLPNNNAVSEVWEVDSDSALPSGITIFDAVRLADLSLNNLSRASRGEFRHRILGSSTAECSFNDSVGESCVEFRSHAGDEVCGGVDRGACGGWCPLPQVCIDGGCELLCDEDGDCGGLETCVDGVCVHNSPAGYAQCNEVGRCLVVVCTDTVASTASKFRSDDTFTTLSHEFGHALGVNHPNLGSCGTGGTALCASSDDCDGELLCTALGCSIGLTPQDGDSEGIRHNYGSFDGSFRTRKVFRAGYGAVGSGSIPIPEFGALTGLFSAHFPRLDCTRTSAANMRCAMIRHRVVGGESVMRVNALTAPNGAGWSTTVVTDLPEQPTFAPDVAVGPSGQGTYVAWAEQGRVFSARSCAICDPVIDDITEITASGEGRTDTRVSAIHPPRIVYLDALGEVLVVIYGVKRDTDGDFTTPEMQAYRLPGNVFASYSQLSGDILLGQPAANRSRDELIAGEFDVACRSVSGSSQCVLVAPQLDDSTPAILNGRPSSALWNVSTSSIATSNWVDGGSFIENVNAVTGVAMSSSKMFVSYGQRNGGTTATTVIARYAGTNIASVEQLTPFRGDAETCATVVVDSSAIPGVSTFGAGHSIAWCETCSTPQLEGLAFGGTSDGTSFCF